MERQFITLFYKSILRVGGGDTVTPKVRPFVRRKPGQKKRTVHVKGYYRHKAI